jgi:NAD(P)-dependent dehydrogenase (short-subunit alcohol dehydrogenase family)
MNRLQGKVALITGGTSGIGYSIAELFAREGAQVMIASRKKEKGTIAIKKISELTGVDARFYPCDVSKEGEVKDLVRETTDIYKRIDILVNSAGILLRKSFENTTEEEWDQIMSTDLKGVFFCCKHIIPFLIRSGSGSIVNISSHVSLVGKSDISVYSAAKGGVTSLTRSLALRYAKHNIRVNCICPGWVITDINRDDIEKAVDPHKKKKELEAVYPLGRLGAPIDVAYAAVYLGSDESQWVTGIALPVDGGYIAGKE